MKKALMLAPMGSVHRRFNGANIQALRDLGYEIHLLANFESGDGPEKQNGDFVKECAEQGIITHSLPYQRHSLMGNLSMVAPTRKLIREGGFDLVHAHTETGGLILRLVGRTKGVRYIYTPHGMSFYKGGPLKGRLIYCPIERWICAGMDRNVAINQEEYSYLQSWNKNTGVLVHGIGLNTGRFERQERSREEVRNEFHVPADAPLIFSVGELDDNKNHRIILDAMARSKRKNIHYIVCGVGPQKENLLEQAKMLGLADRFILAGYRRDIPDLLHASDIFAFPSYHEGMPVSLMEAMAAGLPAIASRIRGCVDLIEDGVNGFLADPALMEEWWAKSEIMISGPSLCKDFSEKSRTIVQNYSMESVTKELTELYKDAAR